VLLFADNSQFKIVEAEIPTKVSVHFDCFIQDCFKHLALLSEFIWVICTWGGSDDMWRESDDTWGGTDDTWGESDDT
jgi:hypothetical protein